MSTASITSNNYWDDTEFLVLLTSHKFDKAQFMIDNTCGQINISPFLDDLTVEMMNPPVAIVQS